MNSLNITFLVINVIVFAWLIRGAFKIANKDFAKFFSIGSTIEYWRDHLNVGDKFVVFPKKFVTFTDANDAFLQFKIRKSEHSRVVDLVYPLKSNSSNDDLKTSELISLTQFFDIKNELYLDEKSQLTFYFFEIDPNVPNHILFLVSLAQKQRGFELNTEIGIRTIPNDLSKSQERYMP